MRTLRLLASLVRDLPALAAYKADRFILNIHSPQDIGPPAAPHAVCMSIAHSDRPVEWPCSEWLEAADRLGANPFWQPEVTSEL